MSNYKVRYLTPVLLLLLSTCYTPMTERYRMENHHWQMFKYYKTLESYTWGVGHEQASEFFRMHATYHYGEYSKFKDAKK